MKVHIIWWTVHFLKFPLQLPESSYVNTTLAFKNVWSNWAVTGWVGTKFIFWWAFGFI